MAKKKSKNGKKIGRPTKLAKPEIAQVITNTICENIRDSAPIRAAVVLAGIRYDTYLDWIERAKNGEQPFRDFSDRIDKAELEKQKELLGKWENHCDNDWRAIDRFLQVRFKEEFGQHATQVNINADKMIAVFPANPGTEEWLKQLEKLKSSGNLNPDSKPS